MSKADIRLAKAFAAGLKRTCRESRVPIRNMDVHIVVTDDKGDTMVYRQSGVPPFITMEVAINGEYVGGFIGHPDTPTGNIDDAS